MIGINDVEAAADQIGAYVVRTPTVPSPGLSRLLGAPVTTKLELLQRTGSFKARGATAKLLALTDAERAAGVVAVSGGNHGIAVAEMAGAMNVKATVVMPSKAPKRAVELAESAGADVRITDDMGSAFALTERLRKDGLTLLHPYDDSVVIAGQGTVGQEFASDAGELTDILVSIGGGGLIAGVATAFKALRPHVRIWGVETVGAEAMSAALAACGPVPVELSSIVSTLSAPTVSQLTYDHVSALVDDVLVVSDADAIQGCLELAEHAKVWAEPAAGCLLPAAREVIKKVTEQASEPANEFANGGGADIKLGLVVCGGNATPTDVLTWANRFGLG